MSTHKNYEKLYKDALERAKKIDIDEAYASQGTIAKTIFPELSESEEERIRKSILHKMEACKKQSNFFSEEEISWLEKQKGLDKMIVVSPEVWDNAIADAYENGKRDGEKQKEPHYTKRNELFDKCVENCDPKTVEEVNKRVDDIMNMPELSLFEQALTNFIGDWEDDEEHWPSQFVKKHGKHILDMAREEMQKEQKPVDDKAFEEWIDDWYQGSEVGGYIIMSEAEFKNWSRGIRNMYQQKPAEWSDTNELVFQDICKHLKEEGYGGWVVLLRALRNGEFQPKQEWSEKDEAFLKVAIAVCNRYSHKDTADWLKSLRPSWKPTEDQMEAIKHAYNSFPNDCPTKSNLMFLYRDLKKLM